STAKSTRRGKVAAKGVLSASDDGATRNRILEAAHRVFIRQGTASARTQEIADEAGVNKALVHYYFGTKALLADAVFARAAGELMPRIFHMVGDASLSLEEKVQRVVREQLRFHSAHPYLAGYLIVEAHTEPSRLQRILSPHGKAPLGVLRRQLADAAAAGEIRPVTAEQFVVDLMSLCVFPFVARPILQQVIGLDEARFRSFISARVRVLPQFFLAGLRP
ncbi:MAG: TetR/AcrR family transcriptional regulator, partial [Gemmatimonadaceae bacterium]